MNNKELNDILKKYLTKKELAVINKMAPSVDSFGLFGLFVVESEMDLDGCGEFQKNFCRMILQEFLLKHI